VTTLRRMRWFDVAEVARLEADLFHDAWSEAAFWSELAGWPEQREYLVAVDETGIAGYGGVSAAGWDADVQTLAVRADRQGTGIGGRLLDALIDAATRRRAPALLLEVRADNTAAQRLYASRGFERISTRRRYYPDGTDALVMRRHLRGGDDG
jgi:ribosomal-protein-alanine N-acetyltransferase